MDEATPATHQWLHQFTAACSWARYYHRRQRGPPQYTGCPSSRPSCSPSTLRTRCAIRKAVADGLAQLGEEGAIQVSSPKWRPDMLGAVASCSSKRCSTAHGRVPDVRLEGRSLHRRALDQRHIPAGSCAPSATLTRSASPDAADVPTVHQPLRRAGWHRALSKDPLPSPSQQHAPAWSLDQQQVA